MNWEALGAIAELVGAIGVIATLIYLSAQIRQNTRAIRGSLTFDSEHSFASINHDAFHDPGAIHLLARAYDYDASLSDFTDEERLRIGLHAREIIQRVAGQHQLYKNGLLEESVWLNRLAWTSGFLEYPIIKQWWESEKSQNTASPELIELLDTYENKTKVILTGVDSDA